MNDQKSLNPTPPTFSAGNRTWSLQIDCGKVRKLRDITGVDVAKLQEGEALGDLVRDYVKLGEVLFILCEDQAEREGVSVEDFYKGIDPLTLGAGDGCVNAGPGKFYPAGITRRSQGDDGTTDRVSGGGEQGTTGADSRGDGWHLIFQCAAIAGVEPWPYSLRQLLYMAQQKQEVHWERTAWVAYHIVAVNSKKRHKPADFNPYYQATKRKPRKKGNLTHSKLHAMFGTKDNGGTT